MSAPFSRLQLAAALLEYDNDPDNPDAPYRSAHESALFAHLRRNVRTTTGAGPRRSSNYVGVALPSETASVGGRESVLDGRRSRGSTLALRNPFGGEDYLEEEEEDDGHEQMDVDLTSWGLDAFISKDKDAKGKGKAAGSPQPLSSVNTHFPTHSTAPPGSIPRMRATRSMSVGNYDHLLPEQDDNRRKSIASPLDLVGHQAAPDTVPFQRRRAASYSFDAALQAPAGPPVVQSIPFPSRSVRSLSPTLDDAARPRSRASASALDLLDGPSRPRSTSIGTMTSRMMLADPDNPFALEPPSRASRFDPKAAAHARTMSNASLGTHMLLDNDGASVLTAPGQQGSRPLSTIDLLRPKVLVMPSPLQPLNTPSAPSLDTTRDGFQFSTDGPPLPPGARSVRDRQLSAVPIASNSFTPNPRMNLSLSQMTFRSTLKVDDRGANYPDVTELPRATEEGEQIDWDPTPAAELPRAEVVDDFGGPPGRPSGKLFGKSLIDDLEARKANMRSKQRVFRGDDRPSMMARGSTRSSTLIDPATLGPRPGTQRMSSYPSQNTRPGVTGAGPLLDFEGDPRMLPPPNRAANNARSVFGVDTLWEREMAKLKEIEAQEAQEKLEQEERERRAASLAPSGKRKKKGKKAAVESQLEISMDELHRSTSRLSTPPVASSPPVLPLPSPAIRGPPPPVDDDASDSDQSDIAPLPRAAKKATDWHSDSSEDEAPRRTTGVGLRYPTRSNSQPTKPPAQIRPADGDESEDDIPLSAAMQRATLRVPGVASRQARDSDSDEDQPLSVLIRKSHSTSILPQLDFDSRPPLGGEEDEDDKPLGLRASHIAPSIRAPSFMGGGDDGDDDDRPLALHPDQQRRSQFAMLSMAQQQQQQMMMQAQMQSNMFMNPSLMGSTFFGPPPMAPMPMMPPAPPMQIPSPPPLQDPTKFGRVDRWRRDVAVEGD